MVITGADLHKIITIMALLVIAAVAALLDIKYMQCSYLMNCACVGRDLRLSKTQLS